MSFPNRCARSLTVALLVSNSAAIAPAQGAGFWEALAGGTADLYLRYRYEHVEDDQSPSVKDADANTLRTALGYRTGLFHGFSGYAQFEDVRAIGNELYSDGGANAVTDRAVVADPEGTEINQAYVSFAGLPQTEVRAGRQEITHRDDPYHRYLGNILWRQNWQSFDALRLTSAPLPATSIDYSYIYNVNRIFGEDNPIADRSDFRMDSHALKLNYGGIAWAELEGYSYLLDFDSVDSGFLSTATYGARVHGTPEFSEVAYGVYTAEFADQTDYADNPNAIDLNYYLAEVGAGRTFDLKVLTALEAKVSYEVLEGDGVSAFQTPLGTNHAFQGWADRFLITPADGVEDLFATLAGTAFGANFMLVYHELGAEDAGYDYGAELDAVLSKTFAEHYTVGLKYAAYDADQNADNLARNGAASTGKQAFDLDKYWVWAELKF